MNGSGVLDSRLIADPVEEWNDEPIDVVTALTGGAQLMQGKRFLTIFLKCDENTGTSHILVEVEVSWDGTNFAAGNGTDGQIIADFSNTGYEFKKIELPPGKWFRVKATGIVTTNGADIDLYLYWVLGA